MKRPAIPSRRPNFFYLLLAGIGIRLLVFLFLNPLNNDGRAPLGHYEHVLFVKSHWAMPPSAIGHETFQPPLYYTLAAVLALVSDKAKFIQVFSLVTSIATLFIARSIILGGTFLKTREGKLFAFLTVCLLPQFVMFSLYLSNDSMAIFLGFLAFFTAHRFLANPTTKTFFVLVLVLALGLLTKGQFLVIGAILFPWAYFQYWRAQPRAYVQKTLVCAAAVALLAGGCTKYIQNAVLYGEPFISSMNFNPSWLPSQQGTYRGLTSIFDVDVLKLLYVPTIDDSTKHSIPLLLYGTFWYQYIEESNFRGNVLTGLIYRGHHLPGPRNIGRYMHLVGIGPAVVLIIGVLAIPLVFSSFAQRRMLALRLFAPMAFGGSIAMLCYQFASFDNWSLFQARFLFPAILGGFVLFDIGAERLARFVLLDTNTDGRTHSINFGSVFKLWQLAFLIGAGSYFAVEIGLRLTGYD